MFDDHECVVGVMSLNGGSIKPCSKPTYRRGDVGRGLSGVIIGAEEQGQ